MPIPANQEELYEVFVLSNFDGMNQQSPRISILDQEVTWMENLVPIGQGNARSLYGVGAPIYTASPKIVIYGFAYNIASISYHVLFFSDGTAVQVKDSDLTTVAISSVAGTFYTSNLPFCAQWGSSGIIIVSPDTPNGYWVWDGTTLYSPGGTFGPSWLTGITNLTPTGTTTSASTSITSVSSTVGISVGQGITGTGIPANTTITNVGSGTLTISQAATASAFVTLTINWYIPSGLAGTAVEIYQNRVWIINGQKLSFSAPASGANFATANGGGSISSSDSFLKVKFTAIKQANGFLYLFGDSSINVISNVQTGGSPPTTTFNNVNIDPQIGTPWRDSLQTFGRAMLFANATGIYIIFGGSAELISDKMNGLFQNIDLSLQPSSAVANVFSLKSYFLNVKTTDIFGTARNLMIAWVNKKFYIASQETVPVYIFTQEISSNLTAWGTNGNTVYPLFSLASATLNKKIQTKLWAGKSPFVFKQAMRLFNQIINNTSVNVSFTGTIDSESSTFAFSLLSFSVLQFQNNQNQNLYFVNNSSQLLTFTSAGTQSSIVDINMYGKFLGETLSSLSQDFTLVYLAIAYQYLTMQG